MEEFLYRWQVLVGSALGPFLAVTLSAIGFWLKWLFDKRNSRREGLRQVEVFLVRAFNDLYSTKKGLLSFAQQLEQIAIGASELRPEQFYMEERAFPILQDVFLSEDLSLTRFKSPYLHNQMNFIDAGLKYTNTATKDMKENFAILNRKNEFLISRNATPENQRFVYAGNLNAFAGSVRELIGFIEKGVKMLTQARVYNSKLRKHRIIMRWWYEGRSFRYFANMDAFRKYTKYPDFFDRINEKIENEVIKSIRDIEASGGPRT